MRHYPTQQELNDLFILDSSIEQGIRWKIKPRKGIELGAPAGSKNGKYLVVQIDRELYVNHRIIWTMVNGEIPNTVQIDHIDGNKKNNSICNLRLASNAHNQINMSAKSNSRTGVRGLSINKSPVKRPGIKPRFAIQVADLSGVKHNFSFSLDVGVEFVVNFVAELRKKLHGEFYKEETYNIDAIRQNIKNNYGICL